MRLYYKIKDMKKVFLLAFVLFAWSLVVNAQESDGKYIEVTGSSEIEVVPDEIHFLIQIKEYWQEEYTGKSNKEEDFRTKVPLAMIEKDLRRSLRKIGIADDAIRTQEIGDYWRQKGKEFLIGKQLGIRLTDFEQINSIIRSVNTWGIESMRIGPVQEKDTNESVKAIRKILSNPVVDSALLSTAFPHFEGSLISNAPKNEAAKITNIRKKRMLKIALVDKAFNALAPKINVIAKPNAT